MTDKEILLLRTGGGFDVFLHYFGEVITSKKLFLNVFRIDSHPSCCLRVHHGRYYLHDFGSTEWSGDCFNLVSRIYNLDINLQFGEILDRIDRELNLFVLSDKEYRTRDYTPLPRRTLPSTPTEPPKYNATLKDFTFEELSYWTKYGIDRKMLERYNVKSIFRCMFQNSVNKTYTVVSTPTQPVFAYVFDKGIKIYRPKSSNRFLYGRYLPKPYVFGLEQLPERGKVLFITGGEKDVIALAAHNFHAISFNSETARVPEEVIRVLSDRFEAIVFLYDADETGKRESQLRVEELRQKNFNNIFRYQLPLRGTKEEKDISDYFRLGRSLEELNNQVMNLITL